MRPVAGMDLETDETVQEISVAAMVDTVDLHILPTMEEAMATAMVEAPVVYDAVQEFEALGALTVGRRNMTVRLVLTVKLTCVDKTKPTNLTMRITLKMTVLPYTS